MQFDIITLNTELNKHDVWLLANKLALNTDKTHYMIFHRAIKNLKQGKSQLETKQLMN